MKIINTKERKIWISELDAWVSMEEYLDTIKNTIENETVGIHPDGYQMKYTSCSDQDGGAGDGGRPIIRKLWSVRLGIKIKAE